jgi:hypothetical protein
MALKKSEFLGACGKAFQIFKAVVDAILAAGGDDEDVARIELMGPQIAELVIAARPKQAAPAVEPEAKQVEVEKEPEVIEITLDPSLSLAEQVRRGNYPEGCVHTAYTDGRVKLSGKAGKRTLVLLDPKGDVTIPEMVKRATALGLSRPIWDDSVAMGYQKPERQRQNPLVFPTEETVLGDVGVSCVPILGGWIRKRSLGLDGAGDEFGGRCRFVFVRES